jgi:hypothetical protein
MDARNHQLKKPPAPFAGKDHGGSACVHVGFGKLSAGDFDAAKPAIARQGWCAKAWNTRWSSCNLGAKSSGECAKLGGAAENLPLNPHFRAFCGRRPWR